VLIVFIIKKKKNGGNYQKKQRREEKDEVWATVKKYLKQNNEMGKEVIDTFTVKRPNPYDLTSMTKEQKIEYKLKQKQLKELKNSNFEQYKKELAIDKINRRKKPKELYVVIFVTRDAKTGVEDEPRAIECEIVMKKIDAKRSQRTIQINGLVDYEKEMKWIKPIKDKQDKIYLDRIKREQQRKAKLEAKNKKKQEIEEAKKVAIIQSNDLVEDIQLENKKSFEIEQEELNNSNTENNLTENNEINQEINNVITEDEILDNANASS
ncbi:MAG: DUF5385 domain-containing protein, partial [Ureaplasma sp.]|nr:DUF5385 domain-containing protein [Ureaplasma sp.]